MKRKILVLFLGLCVLAVLASGTYSFRTREIRAENVIRTGNADFVIHQTDENGESISHITEGILPGDTVKRQITFENTGDNPLYIRAKIDTDTTNNKTISENCLKMDINTDDWAYRDGYYYYLSRLSPGETTEPLLSAVHFDGKEIDNSFIGEKIGLSISADAVQSENNGNGVFGASGW